MKLATITTVDSWFASHLHRVLSHSVRFQEKNQGRCLDLYGKARLYFQDLNDCGVKMQLLGKTTSKSNSAISRISLRIKNRSRSDFATPTTQEILDTEAQLV